MEINILALKAILNRLAGEEADSSAIVDLQQAVSLKGDFSFQLSPLNILQAGLLAIFGPYKIMELNSILEKVGGGLVFP